MDIVFCPAPGDPARRYIEEQVAGQTIAMTGSGDWYPIAYLLKSERGEYLGGCVGSIWAQWLHVRFLWVASTVRRRGFGTKLMDAAEAHAVEHGCGNSTLETHNPEALIFYQRLGYEIAGELTDYPPGFSKYFLRKRLGRSAPAL